MNSRLVDVYAEETKSLRYRLIYLITLELFVLSFVLIYLNMALGLLAISGVLMMGSIAMLSNLLLLEHTRNTVLCGHFVTGILFLVMVASNYLMDSTVISYISWFIAIPAVAAVGIGLSSLIPYAILSLVMILVFHFIDMVPVYQLTPAEHFVMDIVNVTLPLIVLSTTFYFLLREHNDYEATLQKNQLILTHEKNKYQHLSRYDSLTQLANRANFQSHVQSMLNNITSPEQSLTVFFMDLDGMKETNDQYGHESGDLLLLVASKRLKTCLREEDLLARLGGDEFTAVVSHPMNSLLPQQMAERMLNEFKQPMSIGKHQIMCGVSIGLASYPRDGKTVEALLKAADGALYVVKKEGGYAYKVASS